MIGVIIVVSRRRHSLHPFLVLRMLRLFSPSTHFPYTTLFRSRRARRSSSTALAVHSRQRRTRRRACTRRARPSVLDRKSTRLNSSHLVISYAVFCLNKKIKS